MNVGKIQDAIHEGAPKYNKGGTHGHAACLDVYLTCAEQIQHDLEGKESLLDAAIVEATELQSAKKYSDGAWVVRHCFDDILANERERIRLAEAMPTRGFGATGAMEGSDKWQDEKEGAANDFEMGQSLADTAHILKRFLRPSAHRWVGKSYDETVEGHEAVDILTTLGLSPSRKLAVEKLDNLKRAGFLISASHPKEPSFRDGSRLYRIASRDELQSSLDEVMQHRDVSIDGSPQHISMAALSAALEDPEYSPNTNKENNDSIFAGVRTRRLSEIPEALASEDQLRGTQLAAFCAQVADVIEVGDHTYRLKKYENCFVGKDAVAQLVDAGLVESRADAVEELNALTKAGLIHHVQREHEYKDENLFYRFSSASEIKDTLEAFNTLGKTARGSDLVQRSALVNRFKDVAGTLKITSILNDFYGCNDESGWDMSDLENWRLNMKRWGFGRREDQDDEMVKRLSPLLLTIDPEKWDVTGDAEWESPWGILAQIALFDQVSRSAFRGTPKAFAWDELAKRATKVALDRGYFETAYKSTLNQFVLLLPLEHSEDWEDQKLGVSLLLSLLSTVAVIDEGYTDYEIVKRLEFSKRLSVAFLEHAQVIAKFGRYPHRNRAQGRHTALEERIWLASDLVPRWAKSQNPEDQSKIAKVIPTYTIPLKKLTRR
mmetsp:Transcript_4517/g.7721  ORF Transcript_4517/g.7721 Transcript_4517/m.7721 type:complete len:663 (-) Transcript_4517:129-2117(-)